MTTSGPELFRCEGADPAWGRLLEPLWKDLVADLHLDRDFSRVLVCVDDAPDEETTWFRFPAGGGAEGRLVPVEFHCSTGSLVRRRQRGATFHQPAQVWDGREGQWQGELPAADDFSRDHSRAFFYHNFLFIRDLARGEVNPGAVPTAQAASFETAWEVVVDGRLHRAGLPGYSLEDRRGRFSKMFSSAGVLMPNHWQIFQSLWDGGLATQRDVLGVIRQLPRL